MRQPGFKHSEETRNKMSLSAIGARPSTKGIPQGKRSAEVRKRMSEGQKGKKYGIAMRRKTSERQKGEKSHFWKGGVSKVNRTERRNLMSTLEYKLWRESVFERDNYTCVWCGFLGSSGPLNADHIKPWVSYPELRFAIDNGRTLCVPCHRTTDTYAGRGVKRKPPCQ